MSSQKGTFALTETIMQESYVLERRVYDALGHMTNSFRILSSCRFIIVLKIDHHHTRARENVM